MNFSQNENGNQRDSLNFEHIFHTHKKDKNSKVFFRVFVCSFFFGWICYALFPLFHAFIRINEFRVCVCVCVLFVYFFRAKNLAQ